MIDFFIFLLLCFQQTYCFSSWAWGEVSTRNTGSPPCLDPTQRTGDYVQAYLEGACWRHDVFPPRVVTSNSSGLLFSYYEFEDRDCQNNITSTLFFPYDACVTEPSDIYLPPEDPTLGNRSLFFIARAGGIINFPPLRPDVPPPELSGTLNGDIFLFYRRGCLEEFPDSILFGLDAPNDCTPFMSNVGLVRNTVGICEAAEGAQQEIGPIFTVEGYTYGDDTCSGEPVSISLPTNFCIPFGNGTGLIASCLVMPDSSDQTVTILAVVFSFLFCCCVTILVTGLIFYYIKAKDRTYFEYAIANLSSRVKYLEGPYENLSRINGGQGGDVYVGEHEGTKFALKSLRIKSAQSSEQFQNEVNALADFQHPNIIRFWGLYNDGTTLYMVLDYMECGSLLDFFQTKPDLTKQELFQIALRIALGMQVLESRRFIHRDLACRNVLVDRALSIKITDLGLTQKLPPTNIFLEEEKRPLPVRWSAPEVLDVRIYVPKSDVWSWAITIWELFSFGDLPLESIPNSQIPSYISERREMNEPFLSKPDLMPERLHNILCDCWQHSPSDRPSFKELILRMKAIALKKQYQFSEVNSIATTTENRDDDPNYIDHDLLSMTSVSKKDPKELREEIFRLNTTVVNLSNQLHELRKEYRTLQKSVTSNTKKHDFNSYSHTDTAIYNNRLSQSTFSHMDNDKPKVKSAPNNNPPPEPKDNPIVSLYANASNDSETQ